jgi:large subunit ribosomal protein L43
MNAFLQSPLLSQFTSKYPGTEFRVSPRPNKHPIIKAYYINGREKAVCVRNLEKEQILQKVEFLVTNSGRKNELIRGKNVVSTNDNVRGIWSPMHGGIKSI